MSVWDGEREIPHSYTGLLFNAWTCILFYVSMRMERMLRSVLEHQTIPCLSNDSHYKYFLFLVVRCLLRKDSHRSCSISSSVFQPLLLCAPHSSTRAYVAFTALSLWLGCHFFIPSHPSTHKAPVVVLIKGICEAAMYLNISLRIEPRQRRRMT